MIIRIIIINLFLIFLSGIFFNINAESPLSREIRGFPYGKQIDDELLYKSVEFNLFDLKKPSIAFSGALIFGPFTSFASWVICLDKPLNTITSLFGVE